MKNLKRLAIIGTTQIAKSHVDAARKAGFDVCHVAGRKDSSTVNHFARSNSIANVWNDPTTLATSGDWDAIVIASATEALADLLQLSMNCNRAVLVEKPVALDTQMFEQFHGSTEKVMVGFNRRFYEAAQEAKRFVSERPTCLIQLQTPESVVMKPDGEWDYSRVKTNSTHAFDLLSFITGGLHTLDSDLVMHDFTRTSAAATVRSNRGDLCSVIANWNAPANFALTIDCGEERFELKPLEYGVVYRGLEVTQSSSSSRRTYMPKKITTFSESSDSEMYKPGFLGQAQALMDLVHGRRSPIAATLSDAKAAQLFADALIGA